MSKSAHHTDATTPQKITPLQLGKMLGIIHGLGTLIIVPLMLMFTLLASLAQPHGAGWIGGIGVEIE